jgi:hypothetical protein
MRNLGTDLSLVATVDEIVNRIISQNSLKFRHQQHQKWSEYSNILKLR